MPVINISVNSFLKLRWKRELSRHEDLNVNVASRDFRSYHSCDVLLCDHASFVVLAMLHKNLNECGEDGIYNNENSTGLNFCSIILDLRHNESADYFEVEHSHQHNLPRTEVDNPKWWSVLNKYILRCNDMKRLVIDQCNLVYDRFVLQKLGAADEINHLDGVLAMKVAFIFHPSLFLSDQTSLGKRVISWAKQQWVQGGQKGGFKDALFLKAEFLDGDKAIPSFAHRIVLTRFLRAIREPIVQVLTTEGPLAVNSTHSHALDDSHKHLWQMRFCVFSPHQQNAYDRCCYLSRGSLSQSYRSILQSKGPGLLGTLEKTQIANICDDMHHGIAKALLQLRKVCLHSDVDGFVSKLPCVLRKTLGVAVNQGSNGRRLINSNVTGCSEPDIDAARDVASKSSKMRELLLVLSSECGYTVPLDNDFNKNSETKREQGVRVCHGRTNLKRRVLILATLIEAQLLTSFFLSALGLHHEVLISGIRAIEGRSKNDIASSTHYDNQNDYHCERMKNSFSNARKSSIAWGLDNAVLSSSTDANSAPSPCFQNCGIIVASPSSISVGNSGICASSPDVVISVDEDWSGREAFHISTILTRIRSHEKSRAVAAARSSCKFIKLVCVNSCENSFLFKEEAKELADVDIGTKVVKNETRKQSKRMGTRRSPRVDRAADEAAQSGTEEVTLGSKMPTKSKLYCPTVTQFDSAELRTDGYLSPSAANLINPTTNQKRQRTSVGFNILRHRNEELSSVLCVSDKSLYQNMSFMPYNRLEESMDFFFSDSDLSNMFSAVLSKTEEEASYFSSSNLISSIDANASVDIGCDLTHTLMSSSSMEGVELSQPYSSYSSIRYYMRLIGRRFPLPAHELDKKQPPLSLSSERTHTPLASLDNVTKSTSLENEKSIFHQKEAGERKVTKIKVIDHSSSILVYGTPPNCISQVVGYNHPSGMNKLKLPCMDSIHNRLSMCFSLCNYPDFSSRRSEGDEPTAYLPSFYPVLLQIIQNIIVSDSSHGMKRKSYDGMSSSFENKRTKTADILDGIPQLFSPTPEDPFELPDLELSPTGSLDFDSSPMPSVFQTDEAPPDFLVDYFINETVETSSYFLGSSYGIVGNVESFFTKKLLAFDAGGASSFLPSLRLGSMILVTKKEKNNRNVESSIHSKPRQSQTSILNSPPFNPISNQGSSPNETKSGKTQKPTNHAKKLSGKKKIKKHSQNLKTSSQRDRLCRPYFTGEFLKKRMIFTRGGVKYEYASSRLGLARFRFRLNDIVATSFVVLERSQTPSQLGVDRNTEPLPPTTTTPIHVGHFHHMATNNDSVRQSKDFYRCGIALPMGVRTPRLAKLFSSSLDETNEPWTDKEDLLLEEYASRFDNNWHLVAYAVSDANRFSTLKSRRSPMQCRDRWKSLVNRDQKVSFGETESESKSCSDGNLEIPSNPASVSVPYFGKIFENKRNESLLFFEHQSLQKYSSSLKTEVKDSLLKESQSYSRIRKLNDTAKKKRTIPISILGSSSGGAEVTVRLVPIHPSHAESVQAARLTLLAASSNGVAPPPEMWPLKLLDYTDKHRAATANPKATAAHQNPHRGPPVQPRPSQPRQPNARPTLQQPQQPQQPRPPIQPPQPNPNSYYPYNAPQNNQQNRHK